MTSTIIGARTMSQLEDNIGAADLALEDSDVERLNEMTRPKVTFPQSYAMGFASVRQAGTSINGDHAAVHPGFIQPGDDVY